MLIKSLVLLSCGIALLAGCRKAVSAPPAPLSASEIQPAVNHALAEASPEAREEANKYLSEMQSRNWAGAVDDMQQLLSRKDLNYSQKTALAQAMRGTLSQMQDAAEKGDQSAAEVLRAARASK